MVKSLRKDELLRHIREPEKITRLRHVLDLPEISSRNYRATAGDFLDPYEQSLVASWAGHFPDVEMSFEPAGNWERKIPVYKPFPVEEEFVAAFYLEGGDFDHRQILGSLLGMGIERDKIGDIAPTDEGAYVFVKKEIANFIAVNFRKVGAAPISLKEIPSVSVPEIKEDWIVSAAVVSSMRLDAVVRAVTHKSRDEVKGLVAKGLVKVNFKRAEKTHDTVEPGDLISVRGFGRIKIFEPLYKTKKGKVRFQYGTLNSR